MSEPTRKGLASVRRLSELVDESEALPKGQLSEVKGDDLARERRTLAIPQQVADAVRMLDWGRKDAVMRALDIHGADVRDGRVAVAKNMGPLKGWPVSLRRRAWRRVDQIAHQRDWSCSKVVSTLLAEMSELRLRSDRDRL